MLYMLSVGNFDQSASIDYKKFEKILDANPQIEKHVRTTSGCWILKSELPAAKLSELFSDEYPFIVSDLKNYSGDASSFAMSKKEFWDWMADNSQSQPSISERASPVYLLSARTSYRAVDCEAFEEELDRNPHILAYARTNPGCWLVKSNLDSATDLGEVINRKYTIFACELTDYSGWYGYKFRNWIEEVPPANPEHKALIRKTPKVAGTRPGDTSSVWTDQLNALVGMRKQKEQIISIAPEIKMAKLCERLGVDIGEGAGYHSLMLGPPGTGKTTLARIYAHMLHEMGAIKTDNFVELDRGCLVGPYIGQTEERTKKILESALDGVLFVDEAYALYDDSEKDFGGKAIAQIVKFMDDNRGRIVVIMAGYDDKMQLLLGMNPGLRSRFNIVFDFAGYSNDDLLEIAHYMAKRRKLTFGEGAEEALVKAIDEARERDGTAFGNARAVRNILDLAARELCQRLDRNGDLDRDLSAKDVENMRILTARDIKYAERPDALIKQEKLESAMYG
ncbi:MAG: AAA family ATPase [Alphaproteobacteria bacterium]|nr:AAA family ATPase [Alphaproteobacteria bacterium]